MGYDIGNGHRHFLTKHCRLSVIGVHMSEYPPPVADFLMDTEVVDFHHPQIQSLAASLSGRTPLLTAKNCFDWVRDHIEHSY